MAINSASVSASGPRLKRRSRGRSSSGQDTMPLDFFLVIAIRSNPHSRFLNPPGCRSRTKPSGLIAVAMFSGGIKGLPAAQVEVTHAKVGAIRKGKGFLEDREQSIFDVVENTGHLDCPPLGLLSPRGKGGFPLGRCPAFFLHSRHGAAMGADMAPPLVLCEPQP